MKQRLRSLHGQGEAKLDMSDNSGNGKSRHLRLIKPEDISELASRDSEAEAEAFPTVEPGLHPKNGPVSTSGQDSESARAGESGVSASQVPVMGPGMEPANEDGQQDSEPDQEGLSDLLTQSDERALARYLAIRERAPVEVRQYLSKKGILKSWHDSILERLMEMDLLNEERFCMNRIEHRLGSGQGPRRIQQELASLGIERDIARDCLDTVERHQWEEICLEVASKKLEGWMDREDSYWKLMQFLNYRGFESVHIEWAMNALKEKFPHWASRFSSV